MRREQGFTLLEMLVTLAIVALASTVIWQAMAQILRLESSMSGFQLQGARRIVQVAWARDAMRGFLPMEPVSPLRVRGTARELTGLAANPPGEAAIGVGRLALRLGFDEKSGETRLTSSVEGSEPVVLLRWPGDRGGFRYLSSAGEWVEMWPPDMKSYEGVPSAILLETGLEDAPVIVARPPAAGSPPLPSQASVKEP